MTFCTRFRRSRRLRLQRDMKLLLDLQMLEAFADTCGEALTQRCESERQGTVTRRAAQWSVVCFLFSEEEAHQGVAVTRSFRPSLVRFFVVLRFERFFFFAVISLGPHMERMPPSRDSAACTERGHPRTPTATMQNENKEELARRSTKRQKKKEKKKSRGLCGRMQE